MNKFIVGAVCLVLSGNVVASFDDDVNTLRVAAALSEICVKEVSQWKSVNERQCQMFMNFVRHNNDVLTKHENKKLTEEEKRKLYDMTDMELKDYTLARVTYYSNRLVLRSFIEAQDNEKHK